MKSWLLGKLTVALICFTGSVADAAAAGYTARELFELGNRLGDPTSRAFGGNSFAADGKVRILNNDGEVLYTRGDWRPGLWLSKAHYGRTAGLNDLSFAPIPNRSALGFGDDGRFFHFGADPTRPNDPLDTIYSVYQGSPSGEGKLAAGYRYEDYPSDASYVRRQAFMVDGISLDGHMLGHWFVEVRLRDLPDVPFNWGRDPNAPVGLFRDTLVMPLPGTAAVPVCQGRATLAYGIKSISPNGTVLLIRSDACGNALYRTLVVASPLTERIIAQDGPGRVPEIQPVSNMLAVNDAGDVAGVDQGGLWLSRADGSVRRASALDIQDLRFNQAGQLYVLRSNELYVHVRDASETLTLTPLGLSLSSFGYGPGTWLRDVNERGQVLTGVQKTADGKNYAVLFSPSLSVRLTVATNQVDEGQTLTVKATLTSLSDSTISALAPFDSLKWIGTGDWKNLAGPVPSEPVTLLPGGETNLQWQLQGTNHGQGQFSLVMQGTLDAERFWTVPAISELVKIRPLGPDLLIKRADEPREAFIGGREWHTVPVDTQTQQIDVLPGQPAEFDILLGNGTAATNKFVIHAAEDNTPGWRFNYLDGTTDISAAVRSPDGWTSPALPPGGGSGIRVTVTPVTAGAGAAISVRLYVSTTLAPFDPVDLVEARANVQDFVVTHRPADAVVGEFVDVTARFRNASGETLTAVTAELRVTGGGPGFAYDEIQPSRIATVSPGALTEFKQRFVMTNTGPVTFTGLVVGTKPNQQPLTVNAQSTPMPVGALRFAQADPIQTIPDVPLVEAKLTVFYLVATNTGRSAKDVVLDFAVDGVLTTTQEAVADAGRLEGYTTNAFYLISDGAQVEVVGRIRARNGIEDFEYPGNSVTNVVDVVTARRLRYRFGYLTFAPHLEMPSVASQNALAIQNADEPYLNGVYPMPEEPPVGRAFPLAISWHSRSELNWAALMANVDGLARRMGLDRLAVIFPREENIWPSIPGLGDAAGWAYKRPHPIKHVVSLAEDAASVPGYPGFVTAHEIGHTFGFSDVEHPTARSVPRGVWPARLETISDYYDLMDYSDPTWINRTHYELLVKEFTQPAIDPEVLLVNGVLHANGSVTTFPWFTTFVSDADVPDPAGTYAVEFRDAQGNLIVSHGFTPGFEAIGDSFSPAPPNQHREVNLGMAPFCFAIPRPTNLATVRLVHENQVLYERAVTAHAPQVQFISPQGAEVLKAGDSVRLRWQVSDAEGGELNTSVLFSENGQSDWEIVEDLVTVSELDWKVPDRPTRKGRFKLQTTDGLNTTEILSSEFTIVGTGSRLVVSAGVDQFVNTGALVSLDGRGSHLSDGGTIQFQWELAAAPPGDRVTLTGRDTAQPSFTPRAQGSYLFRLTVTDTSGHKAQALTSVNVSEPTLTLGARLTANNRVELTWPTSPEGFELQSNSHVTDPRGWLAVTGETPVLRQGQWTYSAATAEQTRFFRLHRPSDNPADAPVILTQDQVIQANVGLTLRSVDLGSHQLTVMGNGQWGAEAITGTRPSRLILANAGGAHLVAAEAPFLGTLEIRSGRVSPDARLLSSVAAVELNGGTLVLPTNAILASSAPLRLAGGTIEGNGAQGALGPIELSGEVRWQFDGSSAALHVASARAVGSAGKLIVAGWQGSGGNSGTAGKLFLDAAPTTDLLARVSFAGTDFGAGALRLPTGELVPEAKIPSVLPGNGWAASQTYGSVTKAAVAITGQNFSEAVRLTTTQKPDQPYNAGIVLKTSVAVAQNDNLLARFWVRKVDPTNANAQVMFNFELASGSFEKSVQLSVTLSDTAWQLKTIKFKAKAAYAAGAAEASFWTGYGLQTVEIGGLEVLNYKTVTPP